MKIHQISVFLENRTGQLAEITGILAENNVDLRAISIAETADYGVLRIIASEAERATNVLLSHGYILSMTPVIVVAVPDTPGGLAPVLRVLAEGEIAIEYMYSLFTHREGKAYMVFRVSQEERFVELLQAQGIEPESFESLGLK